MLSRGELLLLRLLSFFTSFTRVALNDPREVTVCAARRNIFPCPSLSPSPMTVGCLLNSTGERWACRAFLWKALCHCQATAMELPEAPEEPKQAKEIKPSPSHPSLWFDYPDSDKEKILAAYKLIGEEPVFITPSTFPQQLRFILVGSILLILLFFLYQICTKVIGKKGSA